MRALLAAALVGVVHVHHEPSHDSDAAFEQVLAGAAQAELDFVVLTEHAEGDAGGPLPASEHAGLHAVEGGRRVLVLIGVELPTRDGHLLALDVPATIPAGKKSGREAVDAIHAAGGFAVVPHPFTHGGWRDWDAPFDGLEVHNHASELRRAVGPLLPVRLLRFAWDRDRGLAAMLVRPQRELAEWDRLLAAGRRVLGFSGADAHRNVGWLGWQLDPYSQQFSTVQTICPPGPLEPEFVWRVLRSGSCRIRYRIYESRAAEAREVSFPSGRSELQLDDGRRVLEIRQVPALR